jgi:large subunit ribosomal protein L15
MLNEVTSRAGSRPARKRVGRGHSSGLGKTCGRGHKGTLSRAGGGAHPLHEGGQMPIFRRIPKRGFSNFKFRTEYEVVNVAALDGRFADGETVNIDALRKLRLVRGHRPLVKVLAKGKLGKRLTVEAHAFSERARAAIEQVGGTVKIIARRSPQETARAKRNTAKRKARDRRGNATAEARGES